MATERARKTGAVIAAAGSSQRMNGMDKIFADLEGAPVLARVLDVFEKSDHIDRIVVVTSQANLEKARELVSRGWWPKITAVCQGGSRRQDSVLNGLARLEGCRWVVIHDGARPLVTGDLIARGLEAAAETGAAVAAVPVTDTIKIVNEDLIVESTPPRASLWAVQTPQVFLFDLLCEAYRRLVDDVPDDGTAVERLGHKVRIYRGSYDNIKITNPDDLAVAGVLWRKHGR